MNEREIDYKLYSISAFIVIFQHTNFSLFAKISTYKICYVNNNYYTKMLILKRSDIW